MLRGTVVIHNSSVGLMGSSRWLDPEKTWTLASSATSFDCFVQRTVRAVYSTGVPPLATMNS